MHSARERGLSLELEAAVCSIAIFMLHDICVTDMSILCLAAAIMVVALFSHFSFLGQCLSQVTKAVLQSVRSQPCRSTTYLF